MAKSKIIKDLIGRKIKLTQALERVLVIAMEMNDGDTIKWVKQEKSGYSESDTVPDYRIVSLTPMGSYNIVSMGYLHTFNNHALPTIGLSTAIKDAIEHHKFTQGISQIIDQYDSMNDETAKYGIAIPPEYYHMFEEGTNITVTNAYWHYTKFDLEKIIDAVRTRTIELLVLLEKNFGVLDDLDITLEDYNSNEIRKLQEACAMVINGNNSGDTYIITDSKIKKSIIGKENSANKDTHVDVSVDILSGTESKKSLWKRIVEFFGGKTNG